MAGVLAVFPHLDSAVHAIDELKRKNYGDITVYSPTPRHELEEAAAAPVSKVRVFTLVGALLGVSFGYWIMIWISEYWPLVVGGKAIATWIPYTVFGFEVMVLVGGLSTVFGMFGLSRIPRLTMTVGYDGRFSHGDYGIFVAAAPDKSAEVSELLRKHGATEVRNER